jgi:hypothetical protein
MAPADRKEKTKPATMPIEPFLVLDLIACLPSDQPLDVAIGIGRHPP